MDTYSLFGPSEYEVLNASLQECFVAWLAERNRTRSGRGSARGINETTATVYQEMWNAFAEFCAARGLPLAHLRVRDLELFLSTRGVSGPAARTRVLTKTGDLSDRYARRFLSLIDRVCRFEAARTGCSCTPSAHELLQRPVYRYADAAHKDPLPDYLPEAEAKRLIAHVTALHGPQSQGFKDGWKGLRDRTAVALMLGGGLAPGDVRELRLDGVITAGGRSSDIPWKLVLPGNGNSPARETPLARWAGVQLVSWLTARSQLKLGGDYVFPSTAAGRAWSHTGCFEAGKEVLRAAGLPDDSGGLFKLRHTFALRQLAKGKSEDEVARWLGLVDVSRMARYRRVVMTTVDVA